MVVNSYKYTKIILEYYMFLTLAYLFYLTHIS
jgi:hypothetical protein